ncbi:Purple acid phosphatase [Minicystis rosea]|nr:Purple acid phosphatase [Minicystis rosea]
MCHRRVTFGLAALLATLAACSGGGNNTTGTSTTGTGGAGGHGTGGAGGAPTIASYTPEGCSFSIAPRAEYEGFSLQKPQNGATPNIRRVRLGLGGNVDVGAAGHADPATSIGVAWQTDDDTLSSEITWGSDPDPAKWPAANRASGITWLTPALTSTLQSERMHEVYLCGLTPATTYYYRVGGGPTGGEVWSEVYSFTTTPKAGPSKVTIGVSGDSRGEGNDAWRTIQRRMNVLNPSLQLFSGDMVYIGLDQTAWEKWLDSAWRDADDKPLTLSRQVTLHTHGNHENHTTFFFGNLTLPQDNTKFPKYAELFYSVDVGPVHIVVIDDAWVLNQSGDPDYAGVLGAWLEADLAAADKNRANVPWIMTMHHHGEFSSSAHGEDSEVLRGRQFFVPLWDKYHVDLDLVGHDHNYERSKPLTGPLSDPELLPVVKDSFAEGTVYVICAGAGAPGYTSGTSVWTEVSRDYTQGPAIGFYGLITADATSFKFDAYELHADGSDPIFDTFTIQKP